MAKADPPTTPTPPQTSSSDSFWRSSREEWLSGHQRQTTIGVVHPASIRPDTVTEPPTVEWILLSDAWSLVVKVYQSHALSERFLLQWLAAGQVRWRCLHLEYHEEYADLNVGDVQFWREANSQQSLLIVNWRESWARAHGLGGCAAYRIELARLDILKQLPNQSVVLAPKVAEVKRTRKAPTVEVSIEALINRFKPDGKPPADMSIAKTTLEVRKWCKDQDPPKQPLPGRDSVSRALIRLGHKRGS
jgi:hypothetical protein